MMKELRSELQEKGLLQHFSLLKVQLDELANSFTSILGSCKTMENLSHTEIDMDHIKRKVEESEQEKTFLQQKVSQLEAELQKMIHLVVPEEIRNNEQLLNDYLNRLVQNQSCEVERKNVCIERDECSQSSKKDTEISYIENETIRELPSGNKAKRNDSSKLIEKTPSSLNLSYGNTSNPHHNTDIEFHLNIMEPLSPIKSPPGMRRKLSRLRKRKFNTLLVNSSSDLSSPLQKDSTSSSSKTLVVPNEYNLRQITAIPVDALSSEYSQLEFTKKMKTSIETIGELNPSSESDAIPSYYSVTIKDCEKRELPLSSNTFSKDGAHLPDSSPKGQFSSSPKGQFSSSPESQFQFASSAKNQFTNSPKSQFINSFKSKLNSVTDAASVSEFGKEMYSNSLQINNCMNDVELSSSCHKSLHILKTINESESVVTEGELTDYKTDLDEVSTVPILPNDLMEVHSELSSSERWEIDTVVLSPGRCHDSLEEESTLLQIKGGTEQNLSPSVKSISTRFHFSTVINDKENSAAQESSLSHLENSNDLDIETRLPIVSTNSFSESFKRNSQQSPAAQHRMPQQVNTCLPLLKRTKFSQHASYNYDIDKNCMSNREASASHSKPVQRTLLSSNTNSHSSKNVLERCNPVKIRRADVFSPSCANLNSETNLLDESNASSNMEIILNRIGEKVSPSKSLRTKLCDTAMSCKLPEKQDANAKVSVLWNDLVVSDSSSEAWQIDISANSPKNSVMSLTEKTARPIVHLVKNPDSNKKITMMLDEENTKLKTDDSIVQNCLTEQPQVEIVTNIEIPFSRSFTPDDNSAFLNKSPKSRLMPKKKIAKVKDKRLNKPSSVVHNVSKQQSITLLSKNASFLCPSFHLNKYNKSTCNINSKKVKTSSKLVNLVTATSNNSSFEDCTDIQSSSTTKQNMNSSQLNQSQKIEFSTSQLKLFSEIEKILNRRKNAKSKTSVRKPKWVTKSKNYNKAIIVNDASPSKNVPEIESKMQAYSQTSADVSPIKNKQENIEVTSNSCFEEVPEDISEEEDDDLCVSDSSKSLSEKKYYNYIRRWKGPLRKNFAKSVPKIIASCFRKLKYSLPFTRKLLSSTEELTEAFKDKTVSPENESIVFYVLKYFALIEKYNPVRDFKKQQDPSVFLSPFEECIVNVLLNLEKSEERFKDLILSIVVNIRQLILSVNNLSLNGSCAFCRIYTLICKSKANKQEAISFCCDILKINHRYSPMLIATILGVWKDLLDIPYDVAEEEAVFYGCLRLKAQQLPTISGSRFSGLKISDWESSKCILEKYISASVITPSVDTVDFLVKSIREKCIKGTYAKEYLFTAPLVLFAAYRGWYWAKVNIINKFLIPYICNSVDSVRNSKALTLFCKLYAEISVFYPTNEKPEKILNELFETGKEDKESKFLQECAAPSLIQLLLSRNNPIPEDLLDWYKENESSPACMFLKFHLHRRSLSNKTDFTEEDIL